VKESTANQVKSLLLPFTVLIAIPAVTLWQTGLRIGWGMGLRWDAVAVLSGAVLIGNGLYWLSLSIRLFIFVGRGTLAPWSPTKKLVIVGPYGHVRNPMISAVLIILLGESLAFGSLWLLGWFALAFLINHVYFVYSEEPGLVRRFGDEYLIYERNVPCWIPRMRPWNGEDLHKN
jgi:protein-S-isoprenylcysteine O-methyltransferase Ste14